MTETSERPQKGMQLHTKILLGLVLGAALGILANVTLGGAHPLVEGINHFVAGPIGQIFLNLLFMIVIPLVFASIALGVAGLGDLKRVGRIGAKTLGFFLASTALSVMVGLLLVHFFQPGSRITPEVRTQLLQTYAGDAASRIEAAIGILPPNSRKLITRFLVEMVEPADRSVLDRLSLPTDL